MLIFTVCHIPQLNVTKLLPESLLQIIFIIVSKTCFTFAPVIAEVSMYNIPRSFALFFFVCYYRKITIASWKVTSLDLYLSKQFPTRKKTVISFAYLTASLQQQSVLLKLSRLLTSNTSTKPSDNLQQSGQVAQAEILLLYTAIRLITNKQQSLARSLCHQFPTFSQAICFCNQRTYIFHRKVAHRFQLELIILGNVVNKLATKKRVTSEVLPTLYAPSITTLNRQSLHTLHSI
eukprot:TRINITY_DN2285_c0_g1_i11.p1 TRINITY_DN2285_c0_g1~~TRINITY_DN2285_c0_g1_i11.p1  ORF type:complete len:269 (-),score=-46.21 TRINITY_DN2285_c0_g1_i11:140-841(-)